MPRYRKIPVEVEAVKLTRSITVDTPEGTKTGHPGDYLITHSNGEQYPCDERTFEKLYEPVKGHFDVKLFIKKSWVKIKYKSKEILYNQK